MISKSFKYYQPREGHPDWDRLMTEARKAAEQLRPGLAKPQTGRAERRRHLAAYRTTASNYATNWRRERAGRHDLMPLYFIWTLLRRCNFLCTYCDDHQGQKYPELSDDGILDTSQGVRLLEIMRRGTPAVYFAGGEPTLRQDLPQLTRRARELQYYPIQINTNASAVDRLLRKPDWSTWLADTDIVIVSLDAVELEHLKELWVYRRPSDVLRNLLLLRELASEMRFKLVVNSVVRPGRVQDALDVLDLACDLDIGFVPVPMNIGPTAAGAVLEDPQYPELLRRIVERKRSGHSIVGSERLLKRMMTAAPLDCRNTLKPHIDYDGSLFWPCKASVNVAPERINVLDHPDVASLYRHAASRVSPTDFHGPGPAQCGASCNWAQNYTTDAYRHGLEHPWALLKDLRGFLRELAVPGLRLRNPSPQSQAKLALTGTASCSS